MKKINFCWVLLLILFAGASFAASKEKSLNQIVVIVNDSVITQNEVNQGMIAAKKQLQEMKAPLPSDEELKKQVINNLITRELQRQIVKRANITISDSDLDGALEIIAKRNNIDLIKLRGEVEKSGINYKAYREQVREQMSFTRIQQQEVGRLTVSDQEVEDFLSHYKNVKQPPFTVFVYDPAIYTFDYDYIIRIYKEKYGYEPSREKSTDEIVYVVLPESKNKGALQSFVDYHTPKSEYITKNRWFMNDGTVVLRREKIK